MLCQIETQSKQPQPRTVRLDWARFFVEKCSNSFLDGIPGDNWGVHGVRWLVHNRNRVARLDRPSRVRDCHNVHQNQQLYNILLTNGATKIGNLPPQTPPAKSKGMRGERRLSFGGLKGACFARLRAPVSSWFGFVSRVVFQMVYCIAWSSSSGPALCAA
jgi:hypothetical protein